MSVPALGGEQSLNRYLAEIKKFPVLTAEQEYMLAKRYAEHEDPEAAAQLVDYFMEEAKVVYVDVTKRFRNHGIGSSEPWINFDPNNLGDYNNFHPNEKGYEKGYAKVLKPVVRSLRH